MLKKTYCTKQTKTRRERHRLALTYNWLKWSEVVNLSTLPHMPNEAAPTHYERLKTVKYVENDSSTAAVPFKNLASLPKHHNTTSPVKSFFEY